MSMCIQPGCRQVKRVSVDGSNGAGMDLSVLPNNNHPEKFLQLDVGMLPGSRGLFQVGAVVTSQRHWQNRVYYQVRTPPPSRHARLASFPPLTHSGWLRLVPLNVILHYRHTQIHYLRCAQRIFWQKSSSQSGAVWR